MRLDDPAILELRDLLRENGFDEDRYLAANRDLQNFHADPRKIYKHMLAYGLAEGRELWIADLGSLLDSLERHAGLPHEVKIRFGAGVRKLIDTRPQARQVFAPIDPESALDSIAAHHRGYRWLAPGDLSRTAVALRRVLVVGSCFAKSWRLHWSHISPCDADFVLTNNMGRLGDPPRSIDEYDFQVVQISLRSIMPDHLLWRLDPADLQAHEAAFEQTRERLSLQLRSILDWNRRFGILSFVTNFMVPQRNPVGGLFPRYDLRNPAYFVDRLNAALEQMAADHQNVHILDVDQIAAAMGRMYMQDDTIEVIAHNALLQYRSANTQRIEPLAPACEHLEIKWRPAFLDALWANLLAMYRTLRNVDPIKLVVVDLDDTLWMGVSGERDAAADVIAEGWPLGIVEALMYLRKRGILLAIISKNDEIRVRQVWDDAFGGSLRLDDDFVANRINWRSKAENMQEILTAVRLLPRNTLFIDDNPVERAAMTNAFPGMRVLGKFPYYLRRVLLWAPETQVATISEESSRRTQMVHAQLERETQRKQLSEEEFLESLSLRITLIDIADTAHPRFMRALELLNKTNQFNTTGVRRTLEECTALFSSGVRFHCFEAQDKFTSYGLVGVIIVRDATIEQWVMSCRVLGYRIEEAAMAAVVEGMRNSGVAEIRGRLVPTDANASCRSLFANCGFVPAADDWMLGRQTCVRAPRYVAVVTSESAQPGGQ